MTPPSLPIAAAVVAAAAIYLLARVVVARAARDRDVATRVRADIEALLMAGIDLRGVDDVTEAGNRICRIGTELLGGRGAVLHLRGPGRLLLAGRHGTHPAPIDAELGSDPLVEEVLRQGAVRTGSPVIVPVSGNDGVIGALVVSGATRAVDDVINGVLQLFGGQAGAVIDRIGAVESLFDAATRDPITGCANRQQASSVIASLRPGDGLLVLDLVGFDDLRRIEGESAANLVLARAGLHLRNGTRGGDAIARFSDAQFVVVLRGLKAPIQMVTARLLDSWRASDPGLALAIGAALHLDDDIPLETLDRAESALVSARRRGGGEAHIAPSQHRPAYA